MVGHSEHKYRTVDPNTGTIHLTFAHELFLGK